MTWNLNIIPDICIIDDLGIYRRHGLHKSGESREISCQPLCRDFFCQIEVCIGIQIFIRVRGKVMGRQHSSVHKYMKIYRIVLARGEKASAPKAVVLFQVFCLYTKQSSFWLHTLSVIAYYMKYANYNGGYHKRIISLPGKCIQIKYNLLPFPAPEPILF